MAEITLKGNPIQTVGALPQRGQKAPGFKLVDTELKEVGAEDYAGKRKILNIFPSVDTGICAKSVRSFHQKAGQRDDVVVMNISADLPFAHGRFCGSEGIENAVNLSTFRDQGFGQDFGVTITDGPMAGLLSRAVVVLDEDNTVIYAEQVPEITQEPDYDAALSSLEG